MLLIDLKTGMPVGAPNTTPGATYYYGNSLITNIERPAAVTATAYSPPPAAVQPPLVATFLKTSINTPGSTIMMAYGTCRLGGQIIWGTGIDASASGSSLSTFMSAFCEPADPDEPVRIQKLWANGTLFYDFDAGGSLLVANLTTDAQAALNATCATMALHLGGPGELPDPTMEAIVGTGNAPANRGLRTIVFQDFPLEISNNDFPSISCLFKRTDTTLVRVDDALEAIVTRYRERTGITDSVLVEIDGIDDECYGLTISDQSSLLDQLMRHKDIYNFQIIDGNPIKLVRRAVGADLVIDLAVTEAECLRSGNTPSISMQRKDPASLPVLVTFQYIDPDIGFDARVQQALHEGTQTSTQTMSVQSAFITDATTTRELAFNILYQQRAKSLELFFQLDNIETEVSDVIQLTTDEGDSYTLLVEEQTHTKTRSSNIRALSLLTEAGTDIDGDGGRDGGSFSRKLWPNDVLDWDFVVGSDTIWSIRDYTFGLNSASAPLRRLPSSYFRNMAALDAAGANWGGDAFYHKSGGPAPMFVDAFYVYWLHSTTLTISRLLKTAPSLASVETLVIPEGFYVDGVSDNINITGNQISVYRDGKLYVAWNGRFAGSGGSSTYKLIVIDIDAWSPAAFTAHTYYTPGSDAPAPSGIAVTDNGSVVIATAKGSPLTGDYYASTLADLTTWASTSATFPPLYGCFAQSGNSAYFGEDRASGSAGPSTRKHRLAAIDLSGSLSETVVDLTSKDANFVNIAQSSPHTMWVSDTHLFIYGNHTFGAVTSPENRYVGRFDLGTLNGAGGKFLYEMMYNGNDFSVRRGHWFAGKVYLCLAAFDQSRDSFLEIGEDLSTGSVLHPFLIPSPVNDDFASAQPIYADAPQTNDLTYGSTEADEPVPSYVSTGSPIFVYNNGHSVWYRFIAPTTHSYAVEVANTAGTPAYGIAIYTGTDLTSLSYVAGVGSLGGSGPSAISFSATAGTTYLISVRLDGANDEFGGAINITNHPGRFTILVT